MIHVDLGEPVATRIEKALNASGRAYKANYSNLMAPFLIDGLAHSFVDAAEKFLPGGWEGMFA